MGDRFEHHERIVNALVEKYPSAVKIGFRKALRPIFAECPVFDADDVKAALPSKRPDAFIVDEEEKRVVAFEVENTHRLSKADIARYITLWMYLADAEWDLIVVRVSHFGAEMWINMEEYAALCMAKLGRA